MCFWKLPRACHYVSLPPWAVRWTISLPICNIYKGPGCSFHENDKSFRDNFFIPIIPIFPLSLISQSRNFHPAPTLPNLYIYLDCSLRGDRRTGSPQLSSGFCRAFADPAGCLTPSSRKCVLTCRFCAHFPFAPASPALPLLSRPSPHALSQPRRLLASTNLTLFCLTSKVLHTPASTHELLHQPAFTQRLFYTKHFLQKPTFTPTSFYTNPLSHKLAFPQITFYTNQLLHKWAFTLTSFYANHLLHQPALHNPCFGPVGQRPEGRRIAEGCYSNGRDISWYIYHYLSLSIFTNPTIDFTVSRRVMHQFTYLGGVPFHQGVPPTNIANLVWMMRTSLQKRCEGNGLAEKSSDSAVVRLAHVRIHIYILHCNQLVSSLYTQGYIVSVLGASTAQHFEEVNLRFMAMHNTVTPLDSENSQKQVSFIFLQASTNIQQTCSKIFQIAPRLLTPFGSL